MKYRLTPHATTGHSPAELLLGRQPRSRLDLLHPDVSGRVQESQARQQRAHDSHSLARALSRRPSVCSKFFRIASMDVTNYFGQDWSSFISSSVVRWRKCHIDHVRIRYPEDSIAPNMPEALVGPEQLMARGIADNQASQGQSSAEVVPQVNDPGVSSQSQPRRSGRIRRPPERLC